jgi:peptidoglycan glycosyltransferase
MNKPIRRVAVALAVLFLALFVNLNYVQVVKGGDYRDDARNQRQLLNEYSTPRGQIVVQGKAVADSRKTSDELKYLRVYPQGKLYAPVTGYFSFTHNATGIEAAEDGILSGDSSELFTTKLADILTGRNPRGGSVQLTLNRAAQQAAYNAMRTAHGFKRGAVVALDPTTGAILALVSTPSFDPNLVSSHNSAGNAKAYSDYIKDKDQPMLNRALQQNYPAGSIFKIIDSAAALKDGITSSKRIPARNSYWPLDPGRTSPCPSSLSAPCVENFEGETCDNGTTATLAFALAKSCNTAFAALAVNLGGGKIAEQAHEFGFDEPYAGSRPPDFCQPPALTIPLGVCASSPGSQQDLLVDNAALAQTAFGQRDVRITPLQAAMLSSAVAFNGTLMKPYLVQCELRPNFSVLNETSPEQQSQVLDPDLDQELIKMMEGVVTSPEGTGGPANITDIPDVVVGGKTGTADVGKTSGSGLEPDAWFTGFGLVKGEPKIAVAVVMENAGVSGNEVTGGEAAGPVARKVMEAYLKSSPQAETKC